MVAKPRNLIVWSLCLLMSGGCAMFTGRSKLAERPPLTQEQAAWWEANKHRKHFVPGRGYQIAGVPGYFDDQGRPIPATSYEGIAGTEASENTSGLLDRAAPKKLAADFKESIGLGPNEGVARTALAEGDALFRQKDFDAAAKRFTAAYKRWPDSPLEEEAMFKAAESWFFADRYAKADDAYGELTKEYASTQYLSQIVTRRFAIGRYWEQSDRANPHWPLTPNVMDKTRPRFDTAGHALKVYERIRLEDPTGPLADDSIMATANSYFIKGRWDDADYHYGLIRSEYPKSEFQYQAHLLGLRCKLLNYQGPDYDGKPLDEAEEVATQLLTQFSSELGKERDRVVQVRASINQQRAQREWDMAEYYAKGEYYGAARHFYEKIAKDFPETKLAQESRSRLEQIKDEPANPTDPFEWLVDLLPESTKEGPIVPKPAPAIAAREESTTQQ
ncbi:MAG: outer membrane protein assembly factor BamD [Pirellulales bacterium]